MNGRISWALALALLLVVVTVAAAVPRLINYQGRLTDALGEPLEGRHTLTVSFYSDVADDAVALWTETHSEVEVGNGLFHVVLGSVEPISDTLLSESGLWIGVRVDSEAELEPRVQMTSVPWAMRAAVADALADNAVAYRTAPQTATGASREAEEPLDEALLESIRADLLEAAGVFSELGMVIGSQRIEDAAADAAAAITAMDVEDLTVFEDAQYQIGMLSDYGRDLRDLLASQMSDAGSGGEAGNPLTPGFPNANYSGLCGSTRTNTEAFFAARVVLEVAEGVWAGASRACDQVVVAAGFGGNGSLACIIADEILFAARTVMDEIANCDGDIDSAEIEGSYERLGHLHGDIDIINGKIDALLEAVEALRQANCDIIRLLHTPQGQRESEIPVCIDRPEYPYEWGED